MRRRSFLLVLLLLGAFAPARRAIAEGPPPFVVIVNARNASTTLDRDFVKDAFLKKATRWQDGSVIKPIDLVPSSSVRERFSHEVLKRSVSAVKNYWQQMIFSGRDVPPAEVSGDDDVIKFVVANPGAIGYVSGSARLGDVRVVTVRQ